MSFFNRNDGTTMLVQPAGYGGGLGGGFGDSWLSILLVLLVFGGLWGGFGGMGGMGGMMWPMMMGGMGGFGGMNWLYPWMNQSQQINDGFRDQMINGNINGIRDAVGNGFSAVNLGIAGLGRDICQTGNGITAAVRDGFSAAEIAANGRQMGTMQQLFNGQIATMQGFDATGKQIAEGAYENRLAQADTKYTIATEACATRTADAQNTNALLTAFNAGIQSIKDEFCKDRLEAKDAVIAAKNDTIAQLRQEVLFARGKDSQDVQTADIINGTYTRLMQCPVGTVPVFGNQPIFTCPTNVGGNNNTCPCA